MAISASEARARLFPLIQQVNDDHGLTGGGARDRATRAAGVLIP